MKRQFSEIIGPLVALILITGLIMILAPTFRQWAAFTDVLENSSVLFIMCTGMTVALIGNCIDLSVGSTYALVSVLTGYLLVVFKLPAPLAILGGLVVGGICGAINGFIVTKTGVPPFIATLGTQMAFRGFANMWGAGVDLSRFSADFDLMGKGTIGPVVVSVIAFLCIWFMLSKTKLGFQAFAQGGNEEVARLAGIRVQGIRAGAYIASSLLAGLAGVLLVSSLGGFDPTSSGQFLLPALAAVFLGTTVVQPGQFNPIGTMIAIWFLWTGIFGLQLLGFAGWVQNVFYGAGLVVAVALAKVVRSRSKTA